MKVAVLGSNDFACASWRDVVAKVITKVSQHHGATKLVTGDAKHGTEALARGLARELTDSGPEVYSATSFSWAEPGGYRDRNTSLIAACDVLIVIVCETDERGGPKWSVSEGVRRGKIVHKYSVSEGGDVTSVGV